MSHKSGTRFREIVDRGRPDLSTDEVTTLANGRIYSAPQALANGLVDSVGTLDAAVEQLANRLGARQVRVVGYQRPGMARRNLFMRSAPAAPQAVGLPSEGALVEGGLRALLSRPGFHYLWWPGLGTP